MKIKLFIGIALLLFFLTTPAQNWSTSGGSSERNGLGKTWGPLTVQTPFWEVNDASSTVWGNAIYSFNDRFATSRVNFTPTYRVTVECRKIDDGALLWEKSFPDEAKLYVVGMTEDAVYVHNYASDSLYAFALPDGGLRWVCPETAKIYGGSHGIVFACNGDPVVNGPDSYEKSMMRIDKNNGEVLWYNKNFLSVTPGPDFCIFGDRAFKWEGAINTPKRLVAVDLNSGESLFYSDAIPGDGDQELPLTIGPDGVIYGQRDGGDLWAFLDMGSAFAVKWQHSHQNGGMGSYGNIGVGADGTVYYPDGTVITRLNPETGDIFNTSAPVASVAMTGTYITTDPGGVVYVSNSEAAEGKYFAFSPDLQTLLWELPVPYNYYAGPQLCREGFFITAGSGNNIRAYNDYLPHAPVADFIADVREIVEGDHVTFTDISSYGGSNHSWTFPGGVPLFASMVQPPPIRYDLAGTYPVSLSVWQGLGSSELTKTCYIHVSPAVGVSEAPDPKGLVLCPNPAPGRFVVSGDAGTDYQRTLTIRDQQGRNLYQTRFTGAECAVETNLANGVYFITLSGSGRPQTGKLVVVR